VGKYFFIYTLLMSLFWIFVMKLEIRCPYCGKKTSWYENPFRPFCSERCRCFDMARWAEEDYRLSGEPAPQHEEDTSDFL
jgi:endogenous inhibitor of DNA gyrase (YacG/DUF329 family)